MILTGSPVNLLFELARRNCSNNSYKHLTTDRLHVLRPSSTQCHPLLFGRRDARINATRDTTTTVHPSIITRHSSDDCSNNCSVVRKQLGPLKWQSLTKPIWMYTGTAQHTARKLLLFFIITVQFVTYCCLIRRRAGDRPSVCPLFQLHCNALTVRGGTNNTLVDLSVVPGRYLFSSSRRACAPSATRPGIPIGPRWTDARRL